MSKDAVKIALVSATPAAIGPATQAITAAMPGAVIWNILDDRLLQDAGEQGGVTPNLSDRMTRLIQHAATEGADAVLLTCSLYGPVADTVGEALAIPVYAPDDAVFDAVIASGHTDVLLVSAQPGPLADSLSRFEQAASAAGVTIAASGVVATGAAQAALAGDISGLTACIWAAVTEVDAPSAVLLAQYSLAPAAAQLEERMNIPVFSGPGSAATVLAATLADGTVNS